MKQIFTLIFLACLSINMVGQVSFSDDFETYNVGDYIDASSTDWSTWTNKPGSTTDAKVTDERAASGTKSLKIFAEAAAGGPMDILLPFKGTHKTGRFVKTMKMYLAEGKEAYFNYQATPTPGTTWTLNGFLRPDGTFDFTNSANAIIFSTKFPHDAWFEFTMDINLDLNVWKVLIDGNCVGSFTNSTKNIASMNLYPINANSVFFIDDVSFYHELVAPVINDDMGISNVTYNGGRLAGTSNTVSYLLSNNGKSEVNIVDLEISINGTKTNKTYSALALAPGASTKLELDNEVTMIPGENNITISIMAVNGVAGDDEECNNKGSFLVNAPVPAEFKAVLIEEATGTWCPWCVRGTVFMDRLSNAYEGYFIPIAVHNSDPMVITEYDDFITGLPGFSGFPSAAVNRSNITDPSQLEAPFLADIRVPAKAAITAGIEYNTTTRVMNVSTFVTFLEDVEGDYHINLILTEDEVRGTGSSWAQANAYAGGGQGVMGGYELLPTPVPASQMKYDHVARAILGLEATADNSISGPFVKGDFVTVSFSYTLPVGIKPADMYVIPVINKGSEYINAKELTWEQALARGVSNVTFNETPLTNVKTYPNPASSQSNIEITLENSSEVVIELYDMTGKLVAAANHGKLNGTFIIPVNVSLLQNGTYTARILTDEGSTMKKIVVQN